MYRKYVDFEREDLEASELFTLLSSILTFDGSGEQLVSQNYIGDRKCSRIQPKSTPLKIC